MTVIKNQRPIRFSIVIITALCLLMNIAQGQNIRPYKVNDTLTAIKILTLISEKQKVKKSEILYNNEKLIINFWATWCVPCVKEMAVLAEEMKRHRGKLRVICVGYESKPLIERFLKTHPDLLNSDLEIISDDKILVKMFFHQGLPHNVWINNKGIIKSITGGEEITEGNIDKFLNDQTAVMHQKKETPFDMYKPMSIPDSLIEYRSIFNRTLPGVTISGEVVDGGRWGKPVMKRYFVFNDRITHMLWSAFQIPGIWTFEAVNDLIEIRTADSSRYFWPGEDHKNGARLKDYKGVSQDDWARSNTYSYELRTPKPLPDSIFSEKVVSELELNLGIRTWRELRKKNCMVVSEPNNYFQFKSTNPDGLGSCKIIGNQLIVKNATIDKVLEYICSHTYTKLTRPRIEPYLNKTTIKYRVSFTVNLGDDHSNYISQSYLEKCIGEQVGLKFELKNDLFPIIVVRDL